MHTKRMQGKAAGHDRDEQWLWQKGNRANHISTPYSDVSMSVTMFRLDIQYLLLKLFLDGQTPLPSFPSFLSFLSS